MYLNYLLSTYSNFLKERGSIRITISVGLTSAWDGAELGLNENKAKSCYTRSWGSFFFAPDKVFGALQAVFAPLVFLGRITRGSQVGAGKLQVGHVVHPLRYQITMITMIKLIIIFSTFRPRRMKKGRIGVLFFRATSALPLTNFKLKQSTCTWKRVEYNICKQRL